MRLKKMSQMMRNSKNLRKRKHLAIAGFVLVLGLMVFGAFHIYLTPEDTDTIMLKVGVPLAFFLCLLALAGFAKARSMAVWLVIALSVLGGLFVIYLLYNLDKGEIEAADWAQILLVLGLVSVTLLYALSAARQADASIKMAKQMVKPRITPDFKFIGDFTPDRKVAFSVEFYNDGDGPAYDLKAEIQDEGKPASILGSGDIATVLRGHQSIHWAHPDPRVYFPHSERVQRRFLIIKYKDIDGEYEIRQPFVLTTVENNQPYAQLESISRKRIREINLEDELP